MEGRFHCYRYFKTIHVRQNDRFFCSPPLCSRAPPPLIFYLHPDLADGRQALAMRDCRSLSALGELPGAQSHFILGQVRQSESLSSTPLYSFQLYCQTHRHGASGASPPSLYTILPWTFTLRELSRLWPTVPFQHDSGAEVEWVVQHRTKKQLGTPLLATDFSVCSWWQL